MTGVPSLTTIVSFEREFNGKDGDAVKLIDVVRVSELSSFITVQMYVNGSRLDALDLNSNDISVLPMLRRNAVSFDEIDMFDNRFDSNLSVKFNDEINSL